MRNNRGKLFSYKKMIEKLKPGIKNLEVWLERRRKEIEPIAEMILRIKEKDFKVDCYLLYILIF